MTRNVWPAALATGFLLVAGCGAPSETAPARKIAKPPEAVTGQMAAFRMYGMARQWAQDVLLLRLENYEIPEVPGGAGKAGAWRAIFVSPQLGKQRESSYAAVASKSINLREGVFAQLPTPYQPNSQIKPFLIAALKVDSTAAYETALKESADYVAKHPGSAVQFELAFTSQTPNAAWRVIWGPSVSRSNYSIYVDASTGMFMRRSR